MSTKEFTYLPEKWDWDSIIEHVIVHYRWIFVMLLLPVSCIYDLWFYTRNKVVFALSSAPSKHREKVAFVQSQVRDYQTKGEGKGMCTARPGWQTISPQNMSYKQRMYPIQVNLVDVLEIDAERKTVRVEPLVSMGQLTHTLDRLGWTIPIVPELDDLTVGGLVMGTGIETSSHKFGLFQHICLSYELVLADGSVVECTAESDPDLFYSVPWSYGTLGFLVSVTIKIIPSKRFVKLQYYPVRSMESMVETFERETEKSDASDFVECLVFSKSNAVVMTGDLVDSCQPGKLNEIGRWFKPWFFKHVESFLETGSAVEYIPLRDYYHRHSRSIFWEIQDIIPFGNNVVFRYMFGWLIPPKVSLLKLTQGKTLKRLYETQHMIQDMLVPIEDLSKSLKMFDDEVAIYPIWLCPFKMEPNPGMLNIKTDKDKM
ncbi:delta(24)-sterol reductase [Eurytemora carolleeae]|uniref:delta(24)-sterol reductase n=1 Tax=Eurytemora carolleeae TaxID=1294199 RepID=UPI000C75BC1A|nr:delta(24)-sterol reductase [Eurytemora carolleeae]|eukprot:XP_023348946.1 delta(24)-sterol reductase-like [Eurytemora affinis]